MPNPYSTLALARLHRPYVDLGEGSYQSERESLDFVVNGERLSDLLKHDLASRLGLRIPGSAGNPDTERETVEKLLLCGAPDFPDDRYALYVCPECGDFGCGVVAARITREADAYVWHDFGWQTDYEDEVYRDGFQQLGPFRFEAAVYEEVLRASLG